MTSLKKAQAFLGFLMAAAAIGTVVLVSRPAPEPIDRFWFWVGIVGGPLAMAGLLWLFIGLERTRIATDGEGWIAWAKATVRRTTSGCGNSVATMGNPAACRR